MCRLLLMTFACLLILFGISGLWMLPKLIQQKIEQRIQLKIGTKTFERFTKVPIPITVKIYLFNITNSEQVLAGLERPKFQEVGPFMYKQWRRRDIVDFEDNNRRLKYREIKTFYSMYERGTTSSSANSIALKGNNDDNNINTRHNSDISNNNNNNKDPAGGKNNLLQSQQQTTTTTQHNDKVAQSSSSGKILPSSADKPFMLDPNNVNVTIINLPLLSMLNKLAQLEEGSFKRALAAKLASRMIDNGREKILINRPVNQLLFDGYRVDFMESARDLLDTLGFNFNSPLPGNMFGFFHVKNGTWSRQENGELTVFTGRNDSMNDFMMVDNWNGHKQLKVWPSNTEAGNRCNQIQGTDGSQFHPGANRHQLLSIFSPMICTSLQIKFVEDTSCRDIPLLRFTTQSDMFGAPKKNPKNACYCTVKASGSTKSPSYPTSPTSSSNDSNQSSSLLSSARRINDSRCYLDGLMDLSLCQKGAPIAASSPHFYNADPMLALATGLKPKKELHETYLDIEPMTGAVFRAASRAQINAYVEQAALDVVDSNIIGSMTPMVAPLFWLEERAEIDEKSSNDFKNQLLNVVQKAKRSFIYSIVVGIILALVVGVQYWYVTCYSLDEARLESRKLAAAKKGKHAMVRGRNARRPRSPPNSSRRQLRANMRLGGGALISNLAGNGKGSKRLLSSGEDLAGDGGGAADRQSSEEQERRGRGGAKDEEIDLVRPSTSSAGSL